MGPLPPTPDQSAPLGGIKSLAFIGMATRTGDAALPLPARNLETTVALPLRNFVGGLLPSLPLDNVLKNVHISSFSMFYPPVLRIRDVYTASEFYFSFVIPDPGLKGTRSGCATKSSSIFNQNNC
jgi:hypothetical protein